MSSPVQPGDVLAGKYLVERVLGVGGMGVVVAAKHVQLEEPVAIKFMLEDALKIPDAVARFLREAKAAARLKSEHVARVTDVGTLETGSPYMVMEYLEGVDLGQLLQTQGPLTPEDAVDYVLQACEGLAEAHSVGIVHRDLKPANLFLAKRPGGTSTVKVLDFGISKITSPGGKDARVTGTTTLVGSPTYMSPEQLKSSRDVDPRADVWALGVTLFELLSGTVPYEGETMPLLCAKILTEAPRDLASIRPELPRGLRDAVMHCLVHDPEQRFASVAHLAQALAPFGTERSQQWVERASVLLDAPPSMRSRPQPSAPAIVQPPPQARTATSFGTSTHQQSRVPKGLLVAVGALGLGGAIVAIFLAGRSSSAPAAAPDAATASATAVTTTSVSAAPTVPPPPTVTAAPPEPTPTPVASASAAPSGAGAKPGAPKAKPKPGVIPPGGGEDDLYGARRLDSPEEQRGAARAPGSPGDVRKSAPRPMRPRAPIAPRGSSTPRPRSICREPRQPWRAWRPGG